MKLVVDESFLRQPSEPVSVSSGLKLGRDMHKFLLSYNKQRTINKAVGLSAVQIGELKQVFVTNINGYQRTYINPYLIHHSSCQLADKEGCLSFPGVERSVYRWLWVDVASSNMPEQVRLGGLASTVWQHEYDHTRGVLFFDRITDLTERYQGFRLGMSNANPGFYQEPFKQRGKF